jgi:hypothetical protein
MRTVLSQHFLGRSDSSAIDQSMQATEGRHGIRYTGTGTMLIGNIGELKTCVGAKRRRQLVASCLIQISHHNFGSGCHQHLSGRGAQTRCSARDYENTIGDLHENS